MELYLVYSHLVSGNGWHFNASASVSSLQKKSTIFFSQYFWTNDLCSHICQPYENILPNPLFFCISHFPVRRRRCYSYSPFILLLFSWQRYFHVIWAIKKVSQVLVIASNFFTFKEAWFRKRSRKYSKADTNYLKVVLI